MKPICNISRLIFFLAFHLIPSLAYVSIAQNAPITTVATVSGTLPGTVTVPVTVVNFTSIGAISLTLDYNYTVMHFLQAIPNPILPNFIAGDADLGNGNHRITMGWYGMPKSLPDGSVIMSLSFTFIGGSTPLTWFDNGPSCEYADGAYNVLNDLPTSTYYINGYVCGYIGNPGTITGNNMVCQGEKGVSYSIAPIPNAESYNWTVPYGAAIVTGNNTNSILVDFSTNANTGVISVDGINACGNGPVSQLPVTVNTIPLANAGSDTTIPYGTFTFLHAASGGSGSYNYHWSPESLLVNPDLQNPQTVILTTTNVFRLLVTNPSTLCHNTDEVVVNISGGALGVNPVAVPSMICKGSASQLHANPGGGSGNYTYSWTCIPPGIPPWTSNIADPMVAPDSSRQYHVTINDGYSSSSGITNLTVYPLPTATISGGAALCDDGSTTLLTIDLTGTPPWSLIYTNGITTYTINNQNTTPYLINTSDPGIYSVLVIQDTHCSGTTIGTAIVDVFPIPQTPVITITGNDLVSSSLLGNQWYKNGVEIPGANDQNYTPSQTAHYFTVVTQNECVSDPSEDVYYVMTGSFEPDKEVLMIYPNPADDHIVIERGTTEPVMAELFSVEGKSLKRFVLKGKKTILDLKEMLPGFYFVHLNSQSFPLIKM